MMAPSDDPVGRSVFIRYAAEDFEGPPKFRISAATTDGDRSRIAWSSQTQTAEGRHRHGAVRTGRDLGPAVAHRARWISPTTSTLGQNDRIFPERPLLRAPAVLMAATGTFSWIGWRWTGRLYPAAQGQANHQL